MPVRTEISDSSLDGFSMPARQQLESSLLEFATDVISEANRIEATIRPVSAPPDVSAQMVRDACSYVRKMPIIKKTSGITKLGRALSAVLGILLGLFWDKSSLDSSTYLIQFAVLFAFTLIITTAVTLKD
jgi:hypothetical protein